MGVTRRDFLKGAGGAAFGTSLIDWFVGASEAEARAGKLFSEYKETLTVCPYCAVGCGIICHTKDGKLVNAEGDPDHPVNEGALCSKGAALFQVAENERRLTKVRYRAPGSEEWEEKSWDWALPRITKLIKRTRDATFAAKDKDGRTVNRTEGIAFLGGAALDNEECYLYTKLVRALGGVYHEHQARI
jgi:formate dehydrogenase major subunit